MRVVGKDLLRRFIPRSAFLPMSKFESQRVDFVIVDVFKIRSREASGNAVFERALLRWQAILERR